MAVGDFMMMVLGLLMVVFEWIWGGREIEIIESLYHKPNRVLSSSIRLLRAHYRENDHSRDDISDQMNSPNMRQYQCFQTKSTVRITASQKRASPSSSPPPLPPSHSPLIP